MPPHRLRRHLIFGKENMYFDGIKFVLLEKLKGLEPTEWIMFISAIVLAAALIVYLVLRGKHHEAEPAPAKKEKESATLILVHGALCIAIAFVLSYIKLFSMPLGGSITLASMLPLMISANRSGLKWGLLAGLVYGFLQYFQGGYVVHWLQFLLDYPIAFMAIGLGGLVRGEKNLVFSVLIGGVARFIFHLVSGMLVFGEYVMIGADAVTGVAFGEMLSANFVASFVYNAPYLLADVAICAVIALLPPFRKAIRTALNYR